MEQRILAAAVRLFAAKGFDGTSVQEIVDAAEVTKGALYHYFESKNDLLYEIYHTLLSRQLADLDRIVAQSLPADQTLRTLIAELVESTAGYIDETKVWVREMSRLDRPHLHAVRADRRRYHVTFRQVIEDALALTGHTTYPYPRARVLYDYGVMLVQQGEKEQGRSRLAEGLVICRRLGARKDAERTQGALAALDQI